MVVDNLLLEGNAILADSEAIQKKVEQLQEYIDMQENALRAAAGATLSDAAEQQKKAIEDQKQALIGYNKELEKLALWGDRKAQMKAAGIEEMDIDNVTYSMVTVQSYIDSAIAEMDRYKKAWVDARKTQRLEIERAMEQGGFKQDYGPTPFDSKSI